MDGNGDTLMDPVYLPTAYNDWWVQYDLGKPMKLTGMQLMNFGDTLHDAKKVVLQAAASKDADGWHDILHVIAAGGTSKPQDFSVALQPWQGVQHLRLVVKSTYSEHWQPWIREV